MHDREIRQSVVPLLLDFENHIHHFDEGWYYGYGRDRQMRPCLWFSIR